MGAILTTVGDFNGNVGAVAGAIAVADGTGGKTLKGTNTLIDVNNNVTRVGPGNEFNGIIYERLLPDIVSAVTTQVSVFGGIDFDNGESVTIKILWTVKRDSANTGGGGEYICTWTKSGGVLARSFEDDTRKGNNTGASITVTTLDDGGGGIAASIANTGVFNMSGTWYAIILRQH